MHINLNLNTTGFHHAAWRAPGGHPRGAFEITHYLEAAGLAEQGLFDAVFLADHLAIGPRPANKDHIALDPVAVATAIFTRHDRIGVILTASTTLNEPYHVARTLSTLDHLSGGRIGWNVVTSRDPAEAYNVGLAELPESPDRYRRADEFIKVAFGLWDSWGADGLVADPESGVFADTDELRALDHHGEFFEVAGPLQLPESPQGYPLIVQAGGSPGGRAFAANYADAIFTGQHTLPAADEFSQDVRARLRDAGRGDASMAILPGLHIVLGRTESEAWERIYALEELLGEEVRVGAVAAALGVDSAALSLDSPIPAEVLDGLTDPISFLGDGIVDLVREGGHTVRDLSARGIAAHQRFIGTPDQVSDHMVSWFESGAVRGFNVSSDVYPDGLELFVSEVVPRLQREGVFRTAYRDETLRERFGAPAERQRPDRLLAADSEGGSADAH